MPNSTHDHDEEKAGCYCRKHKCLHLDNQEMYHKAMELNGI